jgi:hypothetical protein
VIVARRLRRLHFPVRETSRSSRLLCPASAECRTALRLAAWLNSTWCRSAAAAIADPASGGFARFNARVVSSLPCPTTVLSDEPLLELARAGVAGRLAQDALDDRCAQLLGLSSAERRLAGLARTRSGAWSLRRWWLSRIRSPVAAAGPGVPPERVAAALARALLPPEARSSTALLRTTAPLLHARCHSADSAASYSRTVGTGRPLSDWPSRDASSPVGRSTLVPAVLRAQWRSAAAQTGCEILLHTHELLSRGRLPPAARGAVLIDESHRFRTPSTKRYETLAPWCVGRRGLLLSATPVVNRLEDLAHQLLLLVRDDALAWAELPSLRALHGAGSAGARTTWW